MIYVMSNNKRVHLHGRDGFTLIELMVGILIIGLMTAAAFFGLNIYLENAKKNSTQTTLRNLQQVINIYKSDTDAYPQKLEDLVKDPGVEGWRQPYIKKVPKDGWDRPFVYQVTEDGDNPYEMYSYGGKLGKKEPKSKRIDVWNL